MSYPTLKLTYFNAPGRAELTRLALFINDVPFEDERLDRDQFLARKPTLPFKQVPTLTINGEVFAQSHGMARYVGVLTGLYPSNDPLRAYRVDEILAFSDDIVNKLIPSLFEQDVTKKMAMRRELAEVTLPGLFPLLEARLRATPGGKYFVGDTLTLADIELYCMRKNLTSGHLDGIPTTIIDAYPRWNAIADAVAAHPKVQEWAAKHSS
ncbi:glutathione S-transferase [Achlya hypogyna]|uniref:Glutathione S-transferase n=1 Tax=Achlya hypogyna TaxID=1202772 RepID=A0A1V9YVC1_ACHHY|nr:glutathione S-transferase [Achlya hypogyna]